jgi:hypothetical protein
MSNSHATQAAHSFAHGMAREHHSQHRQHSPAFDPTRAQITAVAAFTTILLAAGFAYPFAKVNMRLSAHEVGGAIMAPGMVMTFDTPGRAMLDMAAVDPRNVSFEAEPTAQGAQTLKPRLDGGVKIFDLEASVVRWPILPGETVEAYAYNNQVPGPTLRVKEGDRVRINVTNRLPESTTVHWHGLILPNDMDGPAEITQKPIEPGETYSYEYTVGQSGTYFYHTHDHVDRQQSLGLYGALIIDPEDPSDDIPADLEYTMQLQEWLKREWLTFPAMPMEGRANAQGSLRRVAHDGNTPDAHPRRAFRGCRSRRRDAAAKRPLSRRHCKCRPWSAVRRSVEGPASRKMARSLPYLPSYHEQQCRDSGRRRLDAGDRRAELILGTRVPDAGGSTRPSPGRNLTRHR